LTLAGIAVCLCWVYLLLKAVIVLDLPRDPLQPLFR